jgi:hypothetical protein
MEALWILVGAVAGYLGRWAQLKFLDDPRARRREREQTMRRAAEVLHPAVQRLRVLSDGAQIHADPSGTGWWAPIQTAVREFIDRYRDEWTVDMDKDHQVSMGVIRLIGSYSQVLGATVGHPPYVVFDHVKDLTAAAEVLHKLLVLRSKGDWRSELPSSG